MLLKQPRSRSDCAASIYWWVTIDGQIADAPGLTESDLARVKVELAWITCGHVYTGTGRINARDDAIDELRGLIERRRENPLLMYSDIRREWENSLAALAAVRRGLEAAG